MGESFNREDYAFGKGSPLLVMGCVLVSALFTLMVVTEHTKGILLGCFAFAAVGLLGAAIKQIIHDYALVLLDEIKKKDSKSDEEGGS